MEMINTELPENMNFKIRSGKLQVLYWVDVGDSINLGAVKSTVGGDVIEASDIQPRETRKSMVSRFIDAPLLKTVSCSKSLLEKRFATYTCGPDAQVSFYSNGFIGISYEFKLGELTGLLDLVQLRELVSSLRSDDALREETSRLVIQQAKMINNCISNSHDPSLLEEYLLIQIEESNFENLDVNNDASLREILAGILCQDNTTKLSTQQIDHTLSNPLSYASSELIFISFDVALLFGKDTDDESRLIEVVNLLRLELRLLLLSFDPQANKIDETFMQLLAQERIDKKSKKLLREAMEDLFQLSRRSNNVLRAARSTLAKTEDPFLSSVYEAASKAFDLKQLIDEVESSEDLLIEKGREITLALHNQNAGSVERTIMYLILIEVIPTICTWLYRLLIILGLGWLLTGPYMDKIVEIFKISH